MEEEDNIIVKWAQEDVETSYNLLNNKNNKLCMTLGFIETIWRHEFENFLLTHDSLIRIMNIGTCATDRDRVGPLNVLLCLHRTCLLTHSMVQSPS